MNLSFSLFFGVIQMDVQQYLERMKVIHEQLLKYIENDQNSNENYQNLIKILDDQKIRENKYELKSLLNIISRISNHHRRIPDFFIKIDQLIQHFKSDITNYFTNYEIFSIFKENKRAILLLIESQLLSIDKSIVNTIKNNKFFKVDYPLYFFPEMKPFLSRELSQEKENEDPDIKRLHEFSKNVPADFEEKRKIGENDNKLCQLIRSDSLKEFIDYIEENKLLIQATTMVEPSLFETNLFLIKNKKITLIEYAAFYGSIQIFKMLSENKKLRQKVMFSAIHSENMELIQLIEDKNADKEIMKKVLKETIKCHHNNLTNYFIENFFKDDADISAVISMLALKYYNFAFLKNEIVNESIFYDLCCNDYYPIVEFILKNGNVDINKIVIQKVALFYSI